MWSFRAMGTEVLVGAPMLASSEEEALGERVADVFEANEHRFSRFRADSELSRLLGAGGSCVVSPQLFDILSTARDYVQATGGLFDPGIGATLVALGYDRSFAAGALDRATVARAPERASLRDVALDPASRSVERPAHVSLDLGGIVKGRTVDEAARLLPAVGVIDAGGDAVLRGSGPDGRGWLVDVEDPRDGERTLLTLVLRDRAVATSAPNRRRWRVGSGHAHHLLDPRTGQPARSDLAQATIVASTAELADVLAKTAYLLGREGARAMIEELPEVGAVLALAEGGVEVIGELEVRAAQDGEVDEARHA